MGPSSLLLWSRTRCDRHLHPTPTPLETDITILVDSTNGGTTTAGSCHVPSPFYRRRQSLMTSSCDVSDYHLSSRPSVSSLVRDHRRPVISSASWSHAVRHARTHRESVTRDHLGELGRGLCGLADDYVPFARNVAVHRARVAGVALGGRTWSHRGGLFLTCDTMVPWIGSDARDIGRRECHLFGWTWRAWCPRTGTTRSGERMTMGWTRRWWSIHLTSPEYIHVRYGLHRFFTHCTQDTNLKDSSM